MSRAATTTDAFNAIAEVGRRDILTSLADGERSVTDLVDLLDVSQPHVSKHLSVLRTVDLVRYRTVGRQRLYRVNGDALRPIHAWVGEFEHLWNRRLDRLDDLLAERLRDEADPNETDPNTTETQKDL